jgi:mannose-6-phosphate isomerase-like protein (cupin superfamily)
LSGSRYSAGPGQEYWFEEGCYILELLNDPADPDVSVARARVPAGTTTAWHFLHGTTERYVILSGSGEVGVGDDPPAAVGSFDVVVIPPGVRQRIRNTGAEDLVFLAICSPRFRSDNYRECSETA